MSDITTLARSVAALNADPVLAPMLDGMVDMAEALEARIAAALAGQEDAKALAVCGCGYDHPTDICMGHIAILNRVRTDHPAFARARADAVAGAEARIAAPRPPTKTCWTRRCGCC